jgi:hypothetical protein
MALKSVCAMFVLYAMVGQFVCIGLALWWVATPSAPTWTEDQVANAQHFSHSMEASRAATRLYNSQTPHGSVSEATVQELLRLRRLALEEASLVRDDVLEKAKPGLSRIWREKYQRSLEISVSAIPRGDAAGQMQAQALWSDWVDWISTNKSEIRVPTPQAHR